MKFKCNGDSMFHVNKGVVVFKMDGSENICMEDCHCYNISNNGKIGSTLCNDNILYKNKIGKSHHVPFRVPIARLAAAQIALNDKKNVKKKTTSRMTRARR